MVVKPLLDYIFVRMVEVKQGAIFVPDAAIDRTKPRHAVVIAVGPGRPSEYFGQTIEYPTNDLPKRQLINGTLYYGEPIRRPVPVKVGDTLMIPGGAGFVIPGFKLPEFEHDQEVRAILPRDLVGIVEGD